MTDIQLLVSLASRIIQSGQICLGRSLRDKGLSAAEANILMFLYLNGDGIKQDEIVSAVEVSKAAISRTVTSLVRKGFLTCVRSPSDRRARLVYLAPRAVEAREFIDDQYAEMIGAASRGIPPEIVRDSIEVFRKVADNLEAYRRELAGRGSP